MSTQGDSLKSIIYALAANASIALAKYVAAFVSGSGSMFAEAIHSTADCGNQLLLLLGIKRSRRVANDDYPLGYGKETYFWSFIVAIMLFSLGGLFSVYEGWHKWHHPQPISHAWLAIAVLLFSVMAEGASMRGCLREVNKSFALAMVQRDTAKRIAGHLWRRFSRFVRFGLCIIGRCSFHDYGESII